MESCETICEESYPVSPFPKASALWAIPAVLDMIGSECYVVSVPGCILPRPLNTKDNADPTR